MASLAEDSAKTISNSDEMTEEMKNKVNKQKQDVNQFEYEISEDPMKNLSPESQKVLSSMLENSSKPVEYRILKNKKIENGKVKFILDIEET